MKLDVSKWNPFKFARKSAQEKRAEPAAATPAAWPDRRVVRCISKLEKAKASGRRMDIH